MKIENKNMIKEINVPTSHIEEIEMIMGPTPLGICRWGVTLITIIVGLVLVSTLFIQWPETLTIQSYIRITNDASEEFDMVIKLSAEQIKLIQEGINARISLNAKNQDWGEYHGKVTHIPVMTDSTKLYPVHICLNMYEKTDKGNASIADLVKMPCLIAHPMLETTVTITLSENYLLQRILKR